MVNLRTSRIFATAILFLALAIVLLNGWMAFRALDRLESSQVWVEHTLRVLVHIEQLMGSVRDAETGNRGYLLTGNAAYLAPYRTAVEELPREMDALRQLIADNPSQRTRISLMRAAIDRRLDLLQRGVALREANDSDGLQVFLTLGDGKEQMDELRQIADDAEREEQTLLTQRTEQARRSGQSARWTVLFASGLDLLLVVFVFRHFVRERAMRLATEQVAAELARSRVEIERNAAEVLMLNRTLEERVLQRTAELETTNRELEAFSYSVSHDLRAPLRTIDGFSSALEEDYAELMDATARDYIGRVRTGVQRMGQLIDALLQLSRITRAEITREPVDLSALAESVAEGVREENPGRAMTIRIEPGMRINADPELLRVALENLFNNAAKFTSKKPETHIEFGWDAAQQGWRIRDNGAGFDMYYAEKLFNAFNRLHGDKDFKGSGIGLATVARVIRRHHGRIWADSVIDDGATFWFTVG